MLGPSASLDDQKSRIALLPLALTWSLSNADMRLPSQSQTAVYYPKLVVRIVL